MDLDTWTQHKLPKEKSFGFCSQHNWVALLLLFGQANPNTT